VSPPKEGVLEPSDVSSSGRDGKTWREGGKRDGQQNSRSKSTNKGPSKDSDRAGQHSRRNQIRSDVAVISTVDGSATEKADQDTDIGVPQLNKSNGGNGGKGGKGKGTRPRSAGKGRGRGGKGGRGGEGGGRGSTAPPEAEAPYEGPTSTEA